MATSVFDVAQHIDWPPGFPGRALANRFWREWSGREGELAASTEATARLAEARHRGDYDLAFVYAGQGVGLLREELPAATVVASMASDAGQLLARWGAT